MSNQIIQQIGSLGVMCRQFEKLINQEASVGDELRKILADVNGLRLVNLFRPAWDGGDTEFIEKNLQLLLADKRMRKTVQVNSVNHPMYIMLKKFVDEGHLGASTKKLSWAGPCLSTNEWTAIFDLAVKNNSISDAEIIGKLAFSDQDRELSEHTNALPIAASVGSLGMVEVVLRFVGKPEPKSVSHALALATERGHKTVIPRLVPLADLRLTLGYLSKEKSDELFPCLSEKQKTSFARNEVRAKRPNCQAWILRKKLKKETSSKSSFGLDGKKKF